MTKMFRVIRRVMLSRNSMLIRTSLSAVRIVDTAPIIEKLPEKVKELKCSRCERTGHLPAFCIAKYDIGGYEIEDDYDGVGTGTHA